MRFWADSFPTTSTSAIRSRSLRGMKLFIQEKPVRLVEISCTRMHNWARYSNSLIDLQSTLDGRFGEAALLSCVPDASFKHLQH